MITHILSMCKIVYFEIYLRDQRWEGAAVGKSFHFIIAVWSTLHHSVHVCMILQLRDKNVKTTSVSFLIDLEQVVCAYSRLLIIVAYFIVARHEPLQLAVTVVSRLNLRTFATSSRTKTHGSVACVKKPKVTSKEQRFRICLIM